MSQRIVQFVLTATACFALATGLFAASAKEQHRAEVDAFFTNHTILRLSLTISSNGMESLRKKPREYVEATLQEGDTVHTVGVHVKGGSGSLRKVDDRPGFTVDFNRFDETNRFHGLKKIHLNNGAQDATRLSEFIGSQLFREAGVPAPRPAHALFEFNGRRMGLYVILESMDKDFLGRTFTNKHGNLYGQTPACDITNKIGLMEGPEPGTYEDLQALAAAVAEEDPARRVARMEKALDVERFISFMAMEIILCHWDGYTFNRHNFRIGEGTGDGRMVFMPHDLDQLMKRQSLGLLPTARGLTSQAVLNTPELRARYLARACDLVTNVFVVPRLTNRVDEAVVALLPTIRAYDGELASNFVATAGELKSRIIGRGLKLQRQLDIVNGRIAPVAFRDGTARLANWLVESVPVGGRMERVKTEGRKSALWIKLGGTNTANAGVWRTSLLLGPGWYRFEGLVRCAGVDSLRWRKGEGAGLTQPSLRLPDTFRLRGDLTWQKVAVDFEVGGAEDVDLLCDLRADKGEAWFAEDSLQLVRLPAAPPAPAAVTKGEKRFGVVPGSTVDKAVQAVQAASAQATNDPTRPIFHFKPPAQWMNTICGALQYNGRYHVFFQFNPWAATNGPGVGWGHASTPNFLRWEFLPPALLPDAQNGSFLDSLGSVALDGYGKPILFFGKTPEGFPKNKRQQWAAMPLDEQLIRWQRVDLGLTPGWGDMFVFRAGERTFATVKESKGLICEAQSRGLTQWKAVGKIGDASGERPNFFPLDGRFVLIQSTQPISYRVGDFDTNKVAFRSADKQPRILDYGPEKKDSAAGRGLTGTTVFTDTKGRTILLGCVDDFKSSGLWNGVMAVPRLLKLNGDQLLQEPIAEVAQHHIRRFALLKPVFLTNSVRALEGPRAAALDLQVEIKPAGATNFGVRLRGAERGTNDIIVRYTPGRLNVAGREVPYTLPAGEVFKLRLLFDRSLLEAFVGGGQIAVTRVVMPPATDLRAEVFAEGGVIQAQRFECWEMRGNW